MNGIELTYSNKSNKSYNPNFFEVTSNLYKKDQNMQAKYDFINMINLNNLGKISDVIKKYDEIFIVVSEKLAPALDSFKICLEKIKIKYNFFELEQEKWKTIDFFNSGAILIVSDILAELSLVNNCMKTFKQNGSTIVKVQGGNSAFVSNFEDFNLYTRTDKMDEAPSQDLEINCFEILMNCLYLNLYVKSMLA